MGIDMGEKILARIADVTVTRNSNPMAPFGVERPGGPSFGRRFDDFTSAITHAMAAVAEDDAHAVWDWLIEGDAFAAGYGTDWDIEQDEDGAVFAYWLDSDE